MFTVNACGLQDGYQKVTGQTSFTLANCRHCGGRTGGRGTAGTEDLLIALACSRPCDESPGSPASHSDRALWAVPKQLARSTECFHTSRWMRLPTVWHSQRNACLSLLVGYTKPAKLVDITGWGEIKECEQGRSAPGPFRISMHTQGSEGTRCPPTWAGIWQERKSWELQVFHLLRWELKAKWKFVFSRL